MLSRLLGHEKLTGTFAIFDIKEGSAGGALVIFKDGKKPLIRYAHRISYGSTVALTQSSPTEPMLKALRMLAERLCVHGLPKILKEERGCRGVDHVIAFLGAPWASVRLLDHPVSSESVITITEKWLKDTLHNLLGVDQNETHTILERSVVCAHLNGYKTNNPCGKSANNINLSVFEAMTELPIAQKITNVLVNSFHTHAVSLRSALLSTFSVVRDYFESEDNFLLLTVGGELTEAALVRNDALIATSVMERGSYTLMQAAAERLQTIPEEALSTLRIRVEGPNTTTDKRTATGLAILESDWQTAFDTLFVKIKTGQGLPRTIFLSAPSGTVPWLTHILTNEFSASHTLTKEPFRVIELNGEELLKHHHLHAEVTPDGPLSLEALFLD